MIQTETHHAQYLETAPGALRDDLSPDTEKVIIIGEDAARQAGDHQISNTPEKPSPIEVKAALESYFDSYVAFKNVPSPTYEYHLAKQFTGDKEVHSEANRAETAQGLLDDLSRYVRTAFTEGQLALDSVSLLPKESGLSIHAISEAIVADMVRQAEARYNAALASQEKTVYPEHITAQVGRPETVEDRTFAEIMRVAGYRVKGFGGRALGLLLVSGPIQTVTQTNPTVKFDAVEVEQ